MSDAVSNNASLPAPGTSQNKHRPVGSFNSLTLLRIKLVKERQSRESSKSQPSKILQAFCVSIVQRRQSSLEKFAGITGAG